MFDHTFRWRNKTIRVFYSLQLTERGLELVLEDICATSLVNVESVPDWKIAWEVTTAAIKHGALYRTPVA